MTATSQLEPAAPSHPSAQESAEGAPQPSGVQLAPGGLWLRLATLLAPLLSHGGLSLLDQIAVSGTRFLTVFIVGRMCGAEQLGLYSLGYSVLIFATCVQESLITVPYLIYSNRRQGDARRRLAGSTLLSYGMLAGLTIVALGGAAAVFAAGIGPQGLAPVMCVLMGVLPLALLRELARRMSFAHLNFAVAIAIDLTTCLLQIGGLFLLVWQGALTAVTAHAVVGAASLIAVSGWLAARRTSFDVSVRRFRPHVSRNWRIGRWVFATQMTTQMTWQGTAWLVAFYLGKFEVGVFAACMTLVSLANPFILAVGNLLGPMAARAQAQEGPQAVRRVGLTTIGVVLLALVVFCLLIGLFGQAILTLWMGPEAAELADQRILLLIAGGTVATALGVVWDTGLWAMARPAFSFVAGSIGMLTLFGVTIPLISTLGILAPAAGVLAATASTSLVQAYFFFRFTSSRSS